MMMFCDGLGRPIHDLMLVYKTPVVNLMGLGIDLVNMSDG
jgi:hypothetical protein